MNNDKVYLDGDWDNNWGKDKLIKFLNQLKIDYFNPGTNKTVNRKEKDKCNIHFYKIINTTLNGDLISEVMKSVNKGKKVLLTAFTGGWDDEQLKKIDTICDSIDKKYGVYYIGNSFDMVARIAERINEIDWYIAAIKSKYK